MRKALTVIIAIFLLVVCGVMFTACNKFDKLRVLPQDYEAESISLVTSESKTEISLGGDDLSKLESLLKKQDEMKKIPFDFGINSDLVYEYFYAPIYTLKVVTERKMFKSTKKYDITLGQITTKRKKSDNSETKSPNKAYLSANNAYGTADDELIEFVNGINEREETRIADAYYIALREAFSSRGYTLTDITLLPNGALKGFNAKLGEISTVDYKSITIYQYPNLEAAKTSGFAYQKQRIAYTVGAVGKTGEYPYDVARSVLNA